jgi:predicted GTPase
MERLNCIIMGAAGRDFHDFLTFFHDHPQFRVCCFTAEQIPFIANRSFPHELAGGGYKSDIPIVGEEELEALIERYRVRFVFLSLSDLSHEEVMHRASRVQAAGASFVLLGPEHTELTSRLPVITITAVRTGAGKSPLSRAVATFLHDRGLRVGVMRHPMPYGDLRLQRVQRFKSAGDLDEHSCTIEEREEYQPYLDRGLVVYAGVDYRAILAAAEAESDVILWDGGNNDGPFLRPSLSIVVADALRAGDELSYYPGETNMRRADVVVVSKVDQATAAQIAKVREHAAQLAPRAKLVDAALRIEVDAPTAITDKRVIVVEDGPTTTHGGMPSGAGFVAAKRHEAREIIDPRPFAMGTIAEAYRRYPHLDRVLPALGYSDAQRRELAATIRSAAPDAVVDGSPARLDRVLELDVPVVNVRYEFEQRSGPDLMQLIADAVR